MEHFPAEQKEMYFDYEKFARELFMGDYYSVRNDNHNVYVFLNIWLFRAGHLVKLPEKFWIYVEICVNKKSSRDTVKQS